MSDDPCRMTVCYTAAVPKLAVTVGEHDFTQRIRGWARRWGVPGLESRVIVELSTRLRRSLGRCVPAKRVVRLNARLLEAPEDLLVEVLCHEVAHVAVYELVGRKRYRPHGPEWMDLMRKAGFQPRVRMDPSTLPSSLDPRHSSRDTRHSTLVTRRFEHRCPVCQAVRFARRRVPQWRCARCLRAGLDGELVITDRSPRAAVPRGLCASG